MEEIIVSVYCLAYQHEKYIRQTLEGFVNQITHFKYEVIVHDDASSDNTSNIIREYAEKYPQIIIPVFQTENKYSQHIPIIKNYILPLLRGKYIAICEGDDYWIDNYKLAKQVEILDNNPNCKLCVHAVEVVDEKGNSIGKKMPNLAINGGFINSVQFIKYCMDYSFQTSSYMIDAHCYRDYLLNPPSFRKGCPVGDVPLLLYFGDLGKVYYIDETMSCYRRGVLTSATVRQSKASSENKAIYARKMANVYELYDNYTQYRYHNDCIARIARYKASAAILNKSEKTFVEEKELIKHLGIKQRLFVRIGYLFPNVVKWLYEQKLRMNSVKDRLNNH